MIDLTKMLLPTDGDPEPQTDHGTTSIAKVEVIFRNHRQRLLDEIARYPVVVGCVAWLTDYAVLRALSSRQHVSIVVQKEDFLKPDSTGTQSMLRTLYGSLPAQARWEFPYTGGYSYCGGADAEAVRCVGNHNSQRKPAFPRMHNKFLVFCERTPRPEEEGGWISEPVKVWTGSYNISDNASRSWENAVLIDDPAIADAYAREFGQIFGFSEPLDWSSAWVEPTYRIGS